MAGAGHGVHRAEARPAASNPAPSSLTTNVSVPAFSRSRNRIVARSPACLHAFCMAFRQQRYTAASISAGYRRTEPACTRARSVAWLARRTTPSAV